MPAVLVAVPTVKPNLLHPLSTSSITARHLLEFMVQEKIKEADAPTIRLDATPSGLSLHYLCHFYAKCPFCCNPHNLSWLGTYTHTHQCVCMRVRVCVGQVPNNAGLHTQWLGLCSNTKKQEKLAHAHTLI